MDENLNKVFEVKPELENKNEDRKKQNGFFSFQKMITLKIIKVFYILGLGIITLYGVLIILLYDITGIYDDDMRILLGLAVIIFGNLFWRLFCEGAVLFFKIYDVLKDIYNRLEK